MPLQLQSSSSTGTNGTGNSGSSVSGSKGGSSSGGSGASGSAFGYASMNGGTTGGASGSSVTVSSLSDLKSACSQSGALTIYVSGSISGSGTISVSSDKSIIGKSGASLAGVGFVVKGVKNVIIQNLSISKVVGADAIGVQKSQNVWLDHLDLSSDQSHDFFSWSF
ncbi:unnamed protein product [Ambrosiozyma monospora]|uniref:Unnamed protein product n=1 Tax=Ambrosiozyma monospora TaxID=43982 RepID=A0ACB5UE95_AMBMO|nr:unnamed protein product [Ambrosiozyma monospora]